jgi:hypothetical protein
MPNSELILVTATAESSAAKAAKAAKAVAACSIGCGLRRLNLSVTFRVAAQKELELYSC